MRKIVRYGMTYVSVISAHGSVCMCVCVCVYEMFNKNKVHECAQ